MRLGTFMCGVTGCLVAGVAAGWQAHRPPPQVTALQQEAMDRAMFYQFKKTDYSLIEDGTVEIANCNLGGTPGPIVIMDLDRMSPCRRSVYKTSAHGLLLVPSRPKAFH